jgi:hypothetical protein
MDTKNQALDMISSPFKADCVVVASLLHCYTLAMVQIKISDLFGNPDFYLFGLENDHALFLPMDRHCYERSIFFDARIKPLQQQIIRVPLAPLFAAISQYAVREPRIGWIFHMAHTGSTLLSRALDKPGKNLVIREPMALRALGVAAGVNGAVTDDRLRLAVTMLDRRYAVDQPVIVKANVPVNVLVPDLLALSSYSKAVFLHFGLEEYLTAILRSPQHRLWVDQVCTEIGLGANAETGALDDLNNAEKAAALWLYQIRVYVSALEKYPATRSLDANTLFDDPVSTLAASSKYFGCVMDDMEVRHIISSDLFSTYAKNPTAAFDNSQRKVRVSDNRALLADEIALAKRWVEPQLLVAPLPDRLARPLCGENSLLV